MELIQSQLNEIKAALDETQKTSETAIQIALAMQKENKMIQSKQEPL